jgi:hypothetical protein
MTTAQASPAVGLGSRRIARVFEPVVFFLLLSVLFGIPAVFLVPPLRGADEPAHVLRAYGITRGEIIPTVADAQGRKGTMLPAHLYEDYVFFETAHYQFGSRNYRYARVFAEYLERKRERSETEAERPPELVLYAGSEGYAPVVYIPYVTAAAVARVAGLDFVAMLWAMRLAGFVVATAAAAYAILIVPRLKWAFVVIAMLPIALYERAIVSADGAALSFTMVITALCLRAALGGRDRPLGAGDRPTERSLWMTLCVLIKPSHTAFVLLEFMSGPLTKLRLRWPTVCLVAAPGLILTLLWLATASPDMAAWRMVEGTGEPAEHFNVGWKLGFVMRHPEHFLYAVLGSFDRAGEHWREMLGVLGWRDTQLAESVYWLSSGVLLAACAAEIELDRRVRYRVAAVAAATVFAYCLAVFVIFYLAWTPIETDRVHGIQGRYFTIALPPAAVAIAALVNQGPRASVMTAIGISGALISAWAMLDAIVRTQW